jgi:sugar phosphate isomerase/epimerase
MRMIPFNSSVVGGRWSYPFSMKIAAFPKCFEYEIGLHHTMSVFEWINMAADGLRVDGLEIYDRFLTSLDRPYLQRVADAVDSAGFVIPMFLCSPDFTHPNPDERKRALDYEARMIEVARFLGGPGTVCRILSGQQRPGVGRDEGIEWVVEAIQQLIPVARSAGVVLGLENHYKDGQWSSVEFALKMDVFLEIVAAVEEREFFGVQYDPSNAVVAGDDPVALLAAVQGRVVSMHASDRYFKDGVTPEQIEEARDTLGYASYLTHGVVGQGLNDYDAIFRILAASGFDGWISIEDGLNGLAEMQASVDYLRGLQQRYFGGIA